VTGTRDTSRSKRGDADADVEEARTVRREPRFEALERRCDRRLEDQRERARLGALRFEERRILVAPSPRRHPALARVDERPGLEQRAPDASHERRPLRLAEERRRAIGEAAPVALGDEHPLRFEHRDERRDALRRQLRARGRELARCPWFAQRIREPGRERRRHRARSPGPRGELVHAPPKLLARSHHAHGGGS
jgi:hypothetical protein